MWKHPDIHRPGAEHTDRSAHVQSGDQSLTFSVASCLTIPDADGHPVCCARRID